MAHLRGGDDIGKLQLILLNKQQLVSGAKDFLFQLPASRYDYCERNEIIFLWKKLSALNIKLDIKGAWKPALKDSNDCFIMEKFMAHLRGGDDIGKLQLILLNKQQLLGGAKDFLFQLPASRYHYCEHNEIIFLWKKLSALNIKLNIKGAWNQLYKTQMTVSIWKN